MEFNPNMVETMKKNKAQSVFINEKGEWLFHETKGYTEHSREDVFGPEGEPKEVKTKVEKVKK